MKILIATRNKDKMEIVAGMLRVIYRTAQIVSLKDEGIEGDVVEEGSIEDRAKTKAQFFWNKLKEKGEINGYMGVLGIDDGIQIGSAEASPNSYELTDDILSGAYQVGTRIFVVRAYALQLSGGEMRTCTTRVPFVFVGNTENVRREEAKYPLSEVLAPEDRKVPLSHLKEDERKLFDLKYAEKDLRILFNAIV